MPAVGAMPGEGLHQEKSERVNKDPARKNVLHSI
jgi:hypothetical protein